MKEKKVGNDQALCSAMHLLLIFAVFPSTMEPASFAMLKQKRKKKKTRKKRQAYSVFPLRLTNILLEGNYPRLHLFKLKITI